jgi:hypothetical protein
MHKENRTLQNVFGTIGEPSSKILHSTDLSLKAQFSGLVNCSRKYGRATERKRLWGFRRGSCNPFLLLPVIILTGTCNRFTWACSGAFLGAYAIVQDINVPVSVPRHVHPFALMAPPDNRSAASIQLSGSPILDTMLILRP